MIVLIAKEGFNILQGVSTKFPKGHCLGTAMPFAYVDKNKIDKTARNNSAIKSTKKPFLFCRFGLRFVENF